MNTVVHGIAWFSSTDSGRIERMYYPMREDGYGRTLAMILKMWIDAVWPEKGPWRYGMPQAILIEIEPEKFRMLDWFDGFDAGKVCRELLEREEMAQK